MIYGFNADEVFKMAIEIENNGRRFYEKVQDMVDDPRIKDIFAMLAQAEIEHKERFSRLKKELPEQTKESTVWDPDNETDQYLKMMAGMHVFRERDGVDKALAQVNTAEDALRLAMGFEKDSIVFFLSMQDATEEMQGQKLIGQLVHEEMGHLKKLSVELKKLRTS